MTVRLDGRDVEVAAGTTVAVAMMVARVEGFAPICAMGVCYQCRATIDGLAHCRSCLIPCREGMEVRSDV